MTHRAGIDTMPAQMIQQPPEHGQKPQENIMYRFENRSTRYVYHQAILDNNIAIVDGDAFHIEWEDDVEFLNNPAPYTRWGKQGTMYTPDGNVKITMVWNEWEETENPDECCDWDDPDYIYIKNEQLDRVREDSKQFPERIYYSTVVRSNSLDGTRIDRWFLSLSHYERYLTDNGYIKEGMHLSDYDYNAPIEAYRTNVFIDGYYAPTAEYVDKQGRKFSANTDGTIYID